jgi:electron transfer flavoprotein alpha subunit
MILVVAEHKDGRLNRSTWEAIAAAQQLAAGTPVKVVVAGHDLAAVAGELVQADVAEVITADAEALAVYTPDGYVQALQQIIATESPDYVAFAHTYQTRDFAPMLASRLDRALVTDVVALKKVGSLQAFARPMFQGKLMADVAPEGPPPHLISVQVGSYRADAARKGGSPAPVRQAAVAIEAGSVRHHPEPPFQEAKQAVDLSQAERIVAVGRGIKQQDNLKVAEELAAALGAELAASRPICDSGWLPMERQIGSSGQTVAPKLYMALGISGAIQHLVGMKGSRVIVAINKDAEAPIFEIADYGIAADLFEIAPALIEALKKD